MRLAATPTPCPTTPLAATSCFAHRFCRFLTCSCLFPRCLPEGAAQTPAWAGQRCPQGLRRPRRRAERHVQREKLVLFCCKARTRFAQRPSCYRSLCEIFLPFSSNANSMQNRREMHLSLVLLCEKEQGFSALEQHREKERGCESTKRQLAL